MNKKKMAVKFENKVESFSNYGSEFGACLNKMISNCKWFIVSFAISTVFGMFGFIVNFFKSLLNIKRIKE